MRAFTNGIIIAALYCFFVPAKLFSQEMSYRNYQVRDGLPSSETYCGIQDHDGYMWFATDAGICRFDGYHFETFTTADGLSDNTVFQLFEDRHGRIWCRTLSGKICYFHEGAFYRIEASDSLIRKAGGEIASALYVDANDTLWLGFDYSGIVKVAPPYGKKEITFIRKDEGLYIRLFENGYTSAMGNKLKGGLSGSDVFSGYIVFPEGNEQQIKLEHSTNTTMVRAFRAGPDWWIMANGDWVYEFRNSRLSAAYHTEVPVIVVYADPQKRIWLGLYDGGLLCFNDGSLKNGKPLHYFGHDPVSSIVSDHEGGLWITSIRNGVYYIPNANMFTYAEYGQIPDNKIFAIAPVGNEVWAGNNNGSIWRLGAGRMQVLKFLDANYRQDNAVMSLLPLGDEVLVGARSSFITDTAGKKIRWLKDVDLDRNSTMIKHFSVLEEGKIVGGNFSMLFDIDVREAKALHSHAIGKTRIISSYAGNGDTLWLGCVNGLWYYFDHRFHYAGDRDALLSHRIDKIGSADGKTLFLATKEAGLVIWDRHKAQVISEKDGLASAFCRDVIMDGRNVWVATNNGVSRLRKKGDGWQIRNITIKDGLVSGEVNQLCLSGGRLWVATSRGVTSFDTATVFSNLVPPPVYITSVVAASKEWKSKAGVTFTYNDNTIEIRFTGLAYRNAGRVSYRYRLLGLDTSWQMTETPEVRFTTLPPGSYEFQVCALNSDGVPSTQPANWTFRIDPPFWMTWWFILVSAVFLFVLGGGLVFLRAQTIRQRENEKAELRQQVSEMEMKALRAQMNPHFIFNAIASIQHFILRNDSKQANKYLTKFSRLIRNVLENSEQENISLRQEVETLTLYLEIESLRFDSRFEYEIDVDPELYHTVIPVPAMLMQPFVENAIWHGLLPKKSDGRLSIRIRRSGAFLHCTVDDDGIGRAASAAAKSGNGRKSIGVNLTEERVKAMNRFSKEKTLLKITDKTDEHGNPAGTRVEIFIPIKS